MADVLNNAQMLRQEQPCPWFAAANQQTGFQGLYTAESTRILTHPVSPHGMPLVALQPLEKE